MVALLHFDHSFQQIEILKPIECETASELGFIELVKPVWLHSLDF
jgi:hypothetical protein